MTTSTHTALTQIARRAAAYIANLNGESETFEIEYADRLAVISYTAVISEDAGDRWTASSWEIKSETATVLAVYDEAGDKDEAAARWLKTMLN